MSSGPTFPGCIGFSLVLQQRLPDLYLFVEVKTLPRDFIVESTNFIWFERAAEFSLDSPHRFLEFPILGSVLSAACKVRDSIYDGGWRIESFALPS